jgi:protein involved in polysaccharide export with SLBB domain
MARAAFVLPSLLAAAVLAGAGGCTPVTPHYGPPSAPARPARTAAPAPVYREPVARVPAYRPRPGSAAPAVAPAPAYVPAGAQVGPPTGATYAPGTFRFAFQVGDEIAVAVWKEKDLDTTQRIQRDGTISPMLLGTVAVAGKTVDEVQRDLEERYREYLREPKVSVRVVTIHSERVFVLGEVKQPAAIPLNGPTMLTQALAQAGGFQQEFADQQRVRIVRTGPDGRPSLITANVSAMLTGTQPIVQVMPGDVVYVPPTGLASWSRGLTQALGPISGIITAAGSVVTSYAAIQALED